MDSKAKTDVINSVTSCYNKNITEKTKQLLEELNLKYCVKFLIL